MASQGHSQNEADLPAHMQSFFSSFGGQSQSQSSNMSYDGPMSVPLPVSAQKGTPPPTTSPFSNPFSTPLPSYGQNHQPGADNYYGRSASNPLTHPPSQPGPHQPSYTTHYSGGLGRGSVGLEMYLKNVLHLKEGTGPGPPRVLDPEETAMHSIGMAPGGPMAKSEPPFPRRSSNQDNLHSRFFPSGDDMGGHAGHQSIGSGDSVEAFFAKARETNEKANIQNDPSPSDSTLNMFFSNTQQGPSRLPLPSRYRPSSSGDLSPSYASERGMRGGGTGSSGPLSAGYHNQRGDSNSFSRFFPDMAAEGQHAARPSQHRHTYSMPLHSSHNDGPFGNSGPNNMPSPYAIGQPQNIIGGNAVERQRNDGYPGNNGKDDGERLLANRGPPGNGRTDEGEGRGRDNRRELDKEDIGDDQEAPRPKRSPKPLPDFSSYRLRELDDQIQNMLSRIAPQQHEINMRNQLSHKIQCLVQVAWPDARVKLYGSSGNHFGLCGADIDMCLFHELSEDETPAGIVTRLAEFLETVGMLDILPLPDARVPIVKFKDCDTGIPVDICLNNYLAVNNTEFLAMYGNIDQRVVDLSRLIKIWAKRRTINEPYTGTLSSYAYVLLAVHFCQTRPIPILPNLQAIPPSGQTECPKVMINNYDCYYMKDLEAVYRMGYGPYTRNHETLAELVLAFFHHFAYNFGYQWDVVSVRTASLLEKKDKEWTLRHNTKKDRFWLCIEDPFEISHNLGRLADKNTLYDIRGEFMRAFRVLGCGGSIDEVCRPYDGPMGEKKDRSTSRGEPIRSPKMRTVSKPNLGSNKDLPRSTNTGASDEMHSPPSNRGRVPRAGGALQSQSYVKSNEGLDVSRGPKLHQQHVVGRPERGKRAPGTHSTHRVMPTQGKAHQKYV